MSADNGAEFGRYTISAISSEGRIEVWLDCDECEHVVTLYSQSVEGTVLAAAMLIHDSEIHG